MNSWSQKFHNEKHSTTNRSKACNK